MTALMTKVARHRCGHAGWKSVPQAAGLLLGLLCAGCTRESVRTALETQRRADAVQYAVFERQHDAIRILLFRDLVARLEQAGPPLTAEQRAAINDVWNDRDLAEFWCVQQERAAALRLVGVDAKLFADQAIVDLLVKSLEARAKRAEQGLAAAAAEEALKQAQ